LRWQATFSAVIGAVWIIFGLLDFLDASHRDVVSGCIALVFAALFLALASGCWFGVRRRWRYSQSEDL
jgi:hypothetical protein